VAALGIYPWAHYPTGTSEEANGQPTQGRSADPEGSLSAVDCLRRASLLLARGFIMQRRMWALMAAALVCSGMLLGGYASAQGFSVTIRVDENGNGFFSNTAGFTSPLPGFLAPDPGPGGLPSVLTYDTLNPPGLVSGDVLLVDPSGLVLDVVRFNADEVNPSGNVGSLLFYSDNIDGFDSLGDTPSPPLAFYTNLVFINEVGNENVNGAVYTPTAGQPGFVAGAAGPVTYVLMSDTPEPASMTLLGLGAVGLVGYAWRRRKA
jgi:hypothetical protein